MDAHNNPAADPMASRPLVEGQMDDATATRTMQDYVAQHDDIVFAETFVRPSGLRRFRLIRVIDGVEYEGNGHSLKWAYELDAKSKYNEAQGALYRAANPGAWGLVNDLDRIAKGHRAFERAGL